MEWQDEGIIIGVKRHGESHRILELMTRNHGRHLGILRESSNRKRGSLLQLGNPVLAHWRARLVDHLGNYSVELNPIGKNISLEHPHALYVIQYISALLRILSERDPHPLLYEALMHLLKDVEQRKWHPIPLLFFELLFLQECGFGLALQNCALTGETEDLIYISPKTGQAISRNVGKEYYNYLLPLPTLLAGLPPIKEILPAPDRDWEISCLEDLILAFRTTSYFLERHLLAPRHLHLPNVREILITHIGKTYEAG